MKSITALALAATVLLADSTHAQLVAPGNKTYVANMRITPTDRGVCGGLLITPTHVLSESTCAPWVEHAVVGDISNEGLPTSGEVLRIVKKTDHPLLERDSHYGYTIFQLERPSKFTPVALADRDPFAYAGSMASTFDWPGISTSLTRTRQIVRSNTDCAAAKLPEEFGPSLFCAGGAVAHVECKEGSGGPTVIERAGKPDLAIGTVWRNDGCDYKREAFMPGVYRGVYAVKSWIQQTAPGVKFE